MPASKNLIGQQFGRLTVIEKMDKRIRNGVVWLCRCECGNLKEVTSSDLNANRVRSCGCLLEEWNNTPKRIDITGNKYGKWTVLYPIDKKTNSRSLYWHCKCDCGTEKDVVGYSLINGGSRSCGCLVTETAKERGEKRRKDYIGCTFGKLTVLEEIGENDKGQRLFLCQCSCENKTQVIASIKQLTNWHKTSCGCGCYSVGEETIKNILSQYNIPFIRGYCFKDLRFSDTNYQAIFDFYVDNQYIIEFDGAQHFKPTRFNGMTQDMAEKQFIKTREHDLIKNEYCLQNNIPLIRIPYQHKNIIIQDLLLKSTNFRYWGGDYYYQL